MPIWKPCPIDKTMERIESMKFQNKFASFKLPLFFATMLVLEVTDASAGCVKSRGSVCGDPNVCVSDFRGDGSRDPNACLPPDVCNVLRDISKKFGSAEKKIEVMSADRKRNCESRGGAGCGSLHAKCRAVDLFIPGIHGENNKAKHKSIMLPFLKAEKAKYPIRYNIYCTGTVHVDDALLTTKLPDSYESCVEGKAYHPWSGKRPVNASVKNGSSPRTGSTN